MEWLPQNALILVHNVEHDAKVLSATLHRAYVTKTTGSDLRPGFGKLQKRLKRLRLQCSLVVLREVLGVDHQNPKGTSMGALACAFGVVEKLESPGARSQHEALPDAKLLWCLLAFAVDWMLDYPEKTLGEARDGILKNWLAGKLPEPTERRVRAVLDLCEMVCRRCKDIKGKEGKVVVTANCCPEAVILTKDEDVKWIAAGVAAKLKKAGKKAACKMEIKVHVDWCPWINKKNSKVKKCLKETCIIAECTLSLYVMMCMV